MNASDLGVVLKGIAPVVREFVAAAVTSLADRLTSLEARGLARDGRDGKDGEKGQVGQAGSNGRDGIDGKDADPALILELKEEIVTLRAELVATKSLSTTDTSVKQMITDAIASLPTPKDGHDGTSVALSDVQPIILSEVEKAVAAISLPKDGVDGASVDPLVVEALITAMVEKAVASVPTPKDGASVTVADVVPLITAEVEKAVASIPQPKDGVGVLGALIDRDGQLVVTLSDGAVKTLGPVVGRNVDMVDVAKMIGDELAKWPRPANGKDGADGLGFDDMGLVDDEHGCVLRFTRGSQVKDFRLPLVVDRGVYKSDRVYDKGDCVTWAGSFWIAQRSTAEKPGDGATGWRLSVKAGRDGKEGKAGPEGPKGLNGKDGRDLTQVDLSTGRKW